MDRIFFQLDYIIVVAYLLTPSVVACSWREILSVDSRDRRCDSYALFDGSRILFYSQRRSNPPGQSSHEVAFMRGAIKEPATVPIRVPQHLVFYNGTFKSAQGLLFKYSLESEPHERELEMSGLLHNM